MVSFAGWPTPSTGGNYMELRACRDTITGGGEDWIDPDTGLCALWRAMAWRTGRIISDVKVTYVPCYLKRTLPPQITEIATGVYKHKKGSDLYDDRKSSVRNNISIYLLLPLKILIRAARVHSFATLRAALRKEEWA